jgi:hypothetical protein
MSMEISALFEGLGGSEEIGGKFGAVDYSGPCGMETFL